MKSIILVVTCKEAALQKQGVNNVLKRQIVAFTDKNTKKTAIDTMNNFVAGKMVKQKKKEIARSFEEIEAQEK